MASCALGGGGDAVRTARGRDGGEEHGARGRAGLVKRHSRLSRRSRSPTQSLLVEAGKGDPCPGRTDSPFRGRLGSRGALCPCRVGTLILLSLQAGGSSRALASRDRPQQSSRTPGPASPRPRAGAWRLRARAVFAGRFRRRAPGACATCTHVTAA